MNTFINEPAKPNFKRKKKRSFIQKFKKKFKKGYLPPEDSSFNNDEYDYFLRVLELERNFKGSKDEKGVFANNALAQTENREVDFSYNQLVSRVIENLLPLATNEVLERYFNAFGTNLRPICVHEFASHVLQALMVIAAKRSFTSESKEEDEEGIKLKDEHVTTCRTWLLKVSKFFLNNIEEFISNRYTNPGLRTAMLCLAGLPQLDKHNKTESKDNSVSCQDVVYKPPEECLTVVKEFYTRISDWPQFKELIDDQLFSGYLQTLLVALKHASKIHHKKLCDKILADCFSSPVTLSSPAALFVLETMIQQREATLQRQIYNELLTGRILDLATARVGNITLQKFMSECCSSDIVAEVVTLLAPDFDKILSAKNGSVLVSLCQACERLKTSQSEFLQSLTKCLGLDNLEESEEQLVPVILSLTPLPHETPPPHTKAGSQLLQSLFKFQKPIKLVNSLLMYESKQLADLLSSQYGSFLTKDFCSSEFIGEKSRQKLIQKLHGHYAHLAQSKFGSRVFDDVWRVADVKNKTKIVKDLASNYSEMKASKFGQFVVRKVWLNLYREKGEEKWREKIQGIQSTKNLFANIIDDLK